MPITAPPTIPQITDPSTFATRAQDWTVWQANELYPAIVDTSTVLTLSTSSTSTTSNTIGTGSKSFTVETGKGYLAGQSLSIAYTTTPTNRMFAVVTSYNSGTGALVVDVQAVEGSGTYAAWSIALAFNGVIGTGQIEDDSITNEKLADNAITLSKLARDGTAGQFLQSQGAGNSPVYADVPSAFSNIQIFTASGTFTVPAGVEKVKVTVVGGGGGGGGDNSTSQVTGGAGGGGGGGAIGIYSVTPSQNIAVTIGAGGAAGNVGNGGAGGTSSFGVLASATGGSGGAAAGGDGGAGGLGSGQISIKGGGGGAGSSGTAIPAGAGGDSILGGGAAGVGAVTTTGFAGDAYGGGGSGGKGSGTATRAGGAGAPGVVIVEY